MENHTDPVTNLARGSNDGHLFLYIYMYAYVCIYIIYAIREKYCRGLTYEEESSTSSSP